MKNLIAKLNGRIKRGIKKIKFHSLTKVSSLDNHVILATNKINKISFHFPYSSRTTFDYRQLHNLHYGYDSYLYTKYTDEDINIKPTDTVIDCGAFVGGFTVAAVKANAKNVFSIEPSSKNFKCLELNLEHYNMTSRVTTQNLGLGDVSGIKKLNLSSSGCDNSFLKPDEGDLELHEKVEVITLKELIEEFQLDPEHLYLKVEAEGFEPEIVRGMGNYMPRIVVVDVTPERNDESPRNMIMEILLEKGYNKFRHTDRCLFAIR